MPIPNNKRVFFSFYRNLHALFQDYLHVNYVHTISRGLASRHLNVYSTIAIVFSTRLDNEVELEALLEFIFFYNTNYSKIFAYCILRAQVLLSFRY